MNGPRLVFGDMANNGEKPPRWSLRRLGEIVKMSQADGNEGGEGMNQLTNYHRVCHRPCLVYLTTWPTKVAEHRVGRCVD